MHWWRAVPSGQMVPYSQDRTAAEALQFERCTVCVHNSECCARILAVLQSSCVLLAAPTDPQCSTTTVEQQTQARPYHDL